MSSSPSSPVKLGLLAPLSGIVELYGQEISWAAEIAADLVNEQGGVLGRPLEIIIANDGSIPETAVPAARSLIIEKECDAIIGNLLSNARISVCDQVAEPLQVPYLNFSFYEGSISSPYFFHFAALPNQQIDKMIPYMAERFGQKFFFAGSDYEWPRGSIDAAKRSLESFGGEVVGEEYWPLGEANPEELLTNLARSGANVFVPYFAGHEQVELLTKFAEMGLKSKIPVVMGYCDEVLVSQLTPATREGLFSSNSYFMTVDTPENAEYLRRLAAQADVEGIWPSGNGFLTNFGEGTYVCVRAYADAVNHAGSLETDAVLEALRTVSVLAPQGTVVMDPTTQHATVNNYLTQCRADGSFQIVRSFGSEAPRIPERYRAKVARGNEAARSTIDSEPIAAGPAPVCPEEGLSQDSELTQDGLLSTTLAEVLTVLGVAAVVVDAEGVVLQVNESAEAAFGYSSSDVVGHNVSIMVPPRFRAEHEVHIAGCVSGSISAERMKRRAETFGYRKDGREFPTESWIVPLESDGETRYLALLRDLTGHDELQQLVRWRAEHDLLTSLLNRDALVERLSKALDRSKESGVGIGLLFIDLDDFQVLNDQYGHQLGDRVLQIIGERLIRAMRGGDTVARLESDEFAVLCEGSSDQTDYAVIAARVRQILKNPIRVDDVELSLSCSIGIAVGTLGETSASGLLRNAAEAARQVKEHGRNDWSFFNPKKHELAQDRLRLATGLRSALAKHEMHCVYQPIVDIGGRLCGVETLLRWNPETGPIPPDTFIPIAELSGSIKEIGAWVFEQACQSQAKLAAMGQDAASVSVSINVSTRQLEQPGFSEIVSEIIQRTKADPNQLVIEVTETALMMDVEQNLAVLSELAAMGCRISIDDFGTGYSSLSLVTKLPLAILKVDRGFVWNMQDSAKDLSVVVAIVGLAHSLGIDVVAEGVETEVQRESLTHLKVNYYQGYLFAKPMTFEGLVARYFGNET